MLYSDWTSSCLGTSNMADSKVESSAEVSVKELKEKKQTEEAENGEDAAANGKTGEENGEQENEVEEDVGEEDEDEDGEGLGMTNCQTNDRAEGLNVSFDENISSAHILVDITKL
ncbi:hypothetical protein F2P81_006201 [Scophthalmus maximus]|uniref:Uncharacterized protein n=1 Tax=Scophthalmus maximus TaxID=52904 RepID=A0A6A4TCQ9_SCOMX|nr:hypothetical protein F2P81_006201 [Scophthalmus maximus]